ncbi:diacylglycerol kinase family protein [Bacillus marinisedimentorum]|uniref:diacylglycerol kinase family protein n=1 Tax=Bacillus marinisedimentorum TaxID=1821260 RepID=UPI000872A582|nr:diacylglycerol kinase family protein [Bacillus marinisedimentorum]
MDSQGNREKKARRLAMSFVNAKNGIVDAIRNEPNLQIHTAAAAAAVIMGFLFSITTLEWIILLLVIGGVLSLELMNTAVERTVDLVTDEWLPLAKQAKDAAAGAVLIFSIIALMAGILIFGPKVLALLG